MSCLLDRNHNNRRRQNANDRIAALARQVDSTACGPAASVGTSDASVDRVAVASEDRAARAAQHEAGEFLSIVEMPGPRYDSQLLYDRLM